MRFGSREDELSFRPFTKATLPSEENLKNKQLLENLEFKKLPEIKDKTIVSNEIKKEIFHLKKLPKTKRFRSEIRINKKVVFFVSIALILFISIFLLRSDIMKLTGLSVQENQSYQDVINLQVNESQTYEWIPENHGQLLNSQISGKLTLIGEGSVKIYLEDKLLLDSSQLKKNEVEIKQTSVRSSLLTGLVVGEQGNESSNEQAGAETSGITPEQISEDLTSEENLSTTQISNLEEISFEGNQTESSPNENVSLPEGNATEENPTENVADNTTENNATENATENITEENVTVYEISFSNICVETCNLKNFNLTKDSYNIRIELDNASLSLDSISYELGKIKNISKENITQENITNITELNITENFTEQLTQYNATVGQPVKWTKKIFIENVSSQEPKKVKIKLPKESSNIVVNSLENKKPKQESFGLDNSGNDTILDINATTNEYEVNYETPAPQITENELSEREKQIKITGPDSVHYENVTAFTNVPEISEKEKARIKIYWLVNDSQVSMNLTYLDENGNGLIDKVKWIVPHLSEQDFLFIIEISNAEHLDENYTFISNIYEQVFQLDNVWSEEIPDTHYVRVTFYQNLTSSNDITLYPRIVSGAPKIEVYEVNGTEMIAEFTVIQENAYNKVLLTNLQGSQDTFDLRVVGGSLEFDHILDPSSVYLVNASALATATGTTTGTQNAGKNIIRLDNNSLIAMWINEGTDATCAMSSSNGTTWGAMQAEAGTETGVAITTNGTGVMYVGYDATHGTGDLGYIYMVNGACSTAGTYADLDNMLTNYRPDAAYDGNHSRYVVCSIVSNLADVDYAYTATSSISWTGAGTISGAVTSTSCSIDVDDNGNVFIASTESLPTAGIRVYNSSAGTFASTSIVVAYNASVDNMHLSILGTTILITAIDATSDDLVVIWSTDNGLTYTNATYAGTMTDPEGCIDSNGNFHIIYTNGTADYIRYVPGSNSFDSAEAFADTGTERYPSVKCTNFPSNNRLNGTRLELVFTDTVTNVYFANITINITGYNTAPTAYFGANPADNNNDADGSIAFDINCSDNAGVSTIQLWTNSTGIWHANYTNSSYTNNTALSVTVNGIPEGNNFKWAVWCNDTAGVGDWTDTNKTFNVDKTAPTITLPVYINATLKKSSDNLILNISVTDANTPQTPCFISLNGGTNQTIAYSGGWCNGTVSLSGLTEGNKTIYVYDNDSVNNMRMNDSFAVQIDNTAPTITLPVYINATLKKSSDNLILNISVTDTGTPQSPCFISLNGGTNQTISYSDGWCNGTVSLSGLTDGNKTISVYDNDSVGNMGLNNSFAVQIDSIGPTIALPLYINATLKKNTDSLILNISVTDANSPQTPCFISLNSETNQTIAYSGGWCNGTVSLSGLTDGNRTIRVYDNDSLNNMAMNDTFAVWIDNTPPVAYQGTDPVDNYNDSDGSIKFDLKCTNNFAVNTIQLWTNSTGVWHANYSNSSYLNNTWLNITVTGITEGSNYKWAVWCNDSVGWTNITTNRTFNVDPIGPVASQGTSPVDNHNDSDGSITFDLKCTDNIAVSTIQLWTNTTGAWQANYTNSSYTNNTWLNITVNGIVNGSNFKWAVWCNDTSGLTNQTTNRTFMVDTVPPVAYQGLNPVDYYNSSSQSVIFDLKCTNNIFVDTIQLWGDWMPASTCSGSLTCGNYGTNVFGCNACSQCDIATYTCTGSLNCDAFDILGEEACLNASAACRWEGGPNACSQKTPLPVMCAELSGTMDKIGNCSFINSTFNGGCVVQGSCMTVGTCGLCGLGSPCSNCATAGCSETGGGWNTNYSNSSYTNNTWLNISIGLIPEGLWKWAVWCNDSVGLTNMTTNRTFRVDKTTPIVTNTQVNDTSVYTTELICVSTIATDSGAGIDKVWAMITYPNSTLANITLVAAGACTGGTMGVYGAEINVGSTTGNLTVNTSYANDTAGNLGYQSPWPVLNVTVTALDSTAPIASQGTSPIDNYNDSDGSITFDLKCSVCCLICISRSVITPD